MLGGSRIVQSPILLVPSLTWPFIRACADRKWSTSRLRRAPLRRSLSARAPLRRCVWRERSSIVKQQSHRRLTTRMSCEQWRRIFANRARGVREFDSLVRPPRNLEWHVALSATAAVIAGNAGCVFLEDDQSRTLTGRASQQHVGRSAQRDANQRRFTGFKKSSVANAFRRPDFDRNNS